MNQETKKLIISEIIKNQSTIKNTNTGNNIICIDLIKLINKLNK